MKAHELARELGISQKELVNFLQQRRLTRNAAAPLAPGAIEAARTAFKPTIVTPKIETNGDRRAVLPPTLSVKDLAEKLGVSPVEVIKKLMASKILATINQVIDFATAEIVADEFGYTVEPVASEDVVATEAAAGDGDVVTTSREELFSLAKEDPGKLKPRPPIVTVMSLSKSAVVGVGMGDLPNEVYLAMYFASPCTMSACAMPEVIPAGSGKSAGLARCA